MAQMMLDCFTEYGPWIRTNPYDEAVCTLMDRHYSRQKVGANKVGRPGQNIVLRTASGDAGWIAWRSKYQRKDGYDAWEVTAFRNESLELSSQMIRWALWAMFKEWGEAPADGIITNVNAQKVHSVHPGYCFKKAEFERIGKSKKGLLLFQTKIDHRYIEYEHVYTIQQAKEAGKWLRRYEESAAMEEVWDCYHWLKAELQILSDIRAIN